MPVASLRLTTFPGSAGAPARVLVAPSAAFEDVPVPGPGVLIVVDGADTREVAVSVGRIEGGLVEVSAGDVGAGDLVRLFGPPSAGPT